MTSLVSEQLPCMEIIDVKSQVMGFKFQNDILLSFTIPQLPSEVDFLETSS